MEGKLAATFGERLRAARLAKHLTQTQAAEYCGYEGHQAVANWESGNNFPELETVVMLAGLLDRSIDWLVWGDDMAGGIASRLRKIPKVMQEGLLMRLHAEIDETEKAVARLPKEMQKNDMVKSNDVRLSGWSAANKRKALKKARVGRS